MPSAYAHYRLGERVRNSVGKAEKRIIDAHPELFYIGLHGPDILFYYRPFKENPVSEAAHEMHRKTGRSFFSSADSVIRTGREKDAHLAYIYGFICHFALDASCHAYINKKAAEGDFSHAEIESELDRELMVMDGLDPVSHKLTEHIVSSKQNAEIISDFYRSITPGQVKLSIKSMVFCLNALTAPSRIKRTLLFSLLKLFKHYEEVSSFVINYEKSSECSESVALLLDMYQSAEAAAVSLVESYGRYLEGSASLSEYYDLTFEGRRKQAAVSQEKKEETAESSSAPEPELKSEDSKTEKAVEAEVSETEKAVETEDSETGIITEPQENEKEAAK